MGNKNIPIKVFIARNPARYFRASQKIVLSKFQSIVRDLEEISINIESL